MPVKSSKDMQLQDLPLWRLAILLIQCEKEDSNTAQRNALLHLIADLCPKRECKDASCFNV